MRRFAAQVGLVSAMCVLSAGALARAQQNPGAHMNVDEFRLRLAPPGQMVEPSLDKLIGTWVYNDEESRFENVLAPSQGTRVYKDLGNGTYSCTQVVYSQDGVRSETQYIGKDDGSESPLMRMNDAGKLVPTSITVAFRWTDDFTSEQTEVDHEIITVSKREITPDGKHLMLTLPTNGYYFVHMHADDPVPDIVMWDKVLSK